MIKQPEILLLLTFAMASPLRAASSSVVLQQQQQQNSLFIGGESAGALYELLEKGVPIDNLPNGTFVEGGNVSCSQTTSSDQSKHVYCAININQEGFQAGETPTFAPGIAAVSGTIETKLKANTGEIELNLSGELSQKLFSLMSAKAGSNGVKVGKNILCQQKDNVSRCSTVINQRGFADFPQARLSSTNQSPFLSKSRGLR